MSTELVGDIENQLGFVEGDIEDYEDMLVVLREQRLDLYQQLKQAKVEAYNE